MMDHLDTHCQILDSDSHESEINLCPEEKFLIAMGKLLTAGAFYPPEHSSSRDVGRKVISAMSQIPSIRGKALIECHPKGINVHGKILDVSIPAARQWHDLLDQLAISSIGVVKEIPSVDLHHMATGLLALKLDSESAVEFVSPDYGAFPDGVEIIPRKFGRRGDSEETAHKIMQTVDEALAKIGDENSTSEEQAEYRELMEMFFATVVERLEKDKSGMGAQAFNSQRPLDEVLQLGSHAIGHALQALEEGNGDLNQLPELFENAEFALSYASDKKTVQLMVDVLQQTVAELTEESQPTKESWVPDPTDYKLSLQEVEEGILGLSAKEEPYTDLRGSCRSEFIAICIDIFTAGISRKAFQRTAQDLAEIISGHLNELEFATLVAGTKNVLFTAPLPEVDRVLPYLLSPIKRSGPEKETRFWLELCKDLEQKAKIAIWPHVVLHLFTDKGAQQGAHSWHFWATMLDTEEMNIQLPRLEAMRGYQFKSFNRKLFIQAPLQLHPLFGVIMGSKIAHDLGPILHSGLAKQSNQKLARLLLAACGKYDPNKQRLFQLLLAESDKPSPSAELKDIAAATLNEALSTLSKDRFNEPWVAPAIVAFSVLAGSPAIPLLEKILANKRMGLFYVWPTACRESAKKSLDRLAQLPGRTQGGRK